MCRSCYKKKKAETVTYISANSINKTTWITADYSWILYAIGGGMLMSFAPWVCFFIAEFCGVELGNMVGLVVIFLMPFGFVIGIILGLILWKILKWYALRKRTTG